MKTFASIDPRRLHTDPEPWKFIETGQRVSEDGLRGATAPVVWDPRPEFVPQTTNAYNRLLNDIRIDLSEDGELGDWGFAVERRALDRKLTRQGFPGIEFDEDGELLLSAYQATDVSDEELEHTRHVLRRLTRVFVLEGDYAPYVARG